MRNLVTALVVVLAFALVSAAQDVPRFETFAGYTYVRANPAYNSPSFSANGGSGQFVVNFNKWVGFVTNVGAVHNGNISDVHLDSTFVHYMFGPRVSIRNNSRFTPYFQYLMGGLHAGTSIHVPVTFPPQPANPIFIPGEGPVPVQGGQVSLRASHSQTSFAHALGGGFDIRISKHVSFRPIELEWFMGRLQNIRTLEDNNQQNLRFSTGFNFTFGAQ
jgi:opacity protein-like surface antigen